MLTIFSVPKPFVGQIDIIQRNAILSWTLLKPRPEIMLFGSEKGIEEICREFNLTHIKDCAYNKYGTPLLDSIFVKVQSIANSRLICFVNTDIILTNSLMFAVQKISQRNGRFLLCGRRWDIDVKGLINYDDPEWEAGLKANVKRQGALHSYKGIDYFIFPAGLWEKIPPFSVGRTAYDNWLIWKARSLSVPVIDATKAVFCVHQEHPRTYSSIGLTPPDGTDDFTESIEAQTNRKLGGGKECRFNILDATHIATPWAILPKFNYKYLKQRFKKRRFSSNLAK